MHETKLGLCSSSDTRPLRISLEPWGEDYTFAPGTRVIVLARGRGTPPWFDVWLQDDGITLVAIEGSVEGWAVFDEGRRVQCGYGRTT